MSNSINTYKKKILISSVIIMSIVFAIINISFYYFNGQYLDEKIKQENESFVLLTTHLLEFSDEDVALTYIEHYSHIHSVEIEFKTDTILFETDGNVEDFEEFQIESNGVTYYLLIDNTESDSTLLNYDYVIYVNIAILLIYFLSILIIYRFANKEINIVVDDINLILKQIKKEGFVKEDNFFFEEFWNISVSLRKSFEQIDYLKDRKDIKLKGLVHDLKTHLTIIYSKIEIVGSQKEIKAETIIDLNKQIIKINEIINDVILENVDKELQNINLSKSINDVINQNASVFESKNIKVNSNIDEDITYKWNKRDFERVVNNILANAFYYSNKNTIVNISLINNKDKYVLSISDEGIGIDSKELDKVFNKNYRSKDSNEYNSKGQGLGLYIVKLLVDNINGKVYPISLETGTKIVIELPYTS